MPWFSRELGDGMQAYVPTNDLLKVFMDATIANAKAGRQWPPDVALFSKYDLERNMVTAYITPTGEPFATALGFKACDKPTLGDLGMLFGAPNAWNIHFGDELPHRNRFE